VGLVEFYTQLTSSQNNKQTQIMSKIDQTQIHKLGDTSKQGPQNILQQILWVCLKSNKRFTHTHTRLEVHNTTQPTHTTEITNATTENTPNRPTKEKSTKNTFQPLEVAGNHSSTVGRRPGTPRKIGASARPKSAPLLADN
jgi:hypothetical protein